MGINMNRNQQMGSESKQNDSKLELSLNGSLRKQKQRNFPSSYSNTIIEFKATLKSIIQRNKFEQTLNTPIINSSNDTRKGK
jgi:hypothetical protein